MCGCELPYCSPEWYGNAIPLFSGCHSAPAEVARPLEQAVSEGYPVVEQFYDLAFECKVEPVEVYDPDVDEVEFQIDPQVGGVLSGASLTFEGKKKIVQHWNSNVNKKRPLSSMQTRFRSAGISQTSQLYRWEKQVEAGGTYREKLRDISVHTYDKFPSTKAEKKRIVTLDLRKIALKHAREINCLKFKASERWATDFKAKHRIVSRKITKFVTSRDQILQPNVEAAALDFVVEAQNTVAVVGPEKFYNGDQAGFELELRAGRTLDQQGVKKVEIIALSKNALTHSYTIMPTMNAAGHLVEPLYLVLKEKDVFGPLVEQTVYRPANVKVSSSKSGKMGKSHLDEWITDVIVPEMADGGELAVDAWSTFTEKNMRKNIPPGVSINIHRMPPGVTGMVQLWDVFGFRIYKNFVRHITEFVILNDVNVLLYQRNNIIKLQSLVYNQLCSPRYTSMWQYSWFKSGYLLERPERFENPVKFCLHGTEILCSICEDVRLFTCSWCQAHLCFSHFFEFNHLCHTLVL